MTPHTLLLALALALTADAPLAGPVLGPGWATFGQVLPQGAAHVPLALGDLETQADVKATWPDGSVRFAVLTAGVGIAPPQAAGGAYVLTAGADETRVVPACPAAAVKFTVAGVAYTAALPREPSADVWLDGPLVTERRSVVSPVNADGVPHPLLQVVFDVRTYRGGAGRLDVTVENVLNKAGGAAVDYDVEVTHAGTVLFARDGVRHPWLARWRRTFALSGLVESVARVDLAPAVAAGAVPRYNDDPMPLVYGPAGPAFDILKPGGIAAPMGGGGGRPDIGPLPDWTARFLVDQSADYRAVTLGNGDAAGTFQVHLREPEFDPKLDPKVVQYKGLGPGRLVSIAERPAFWWVKSGGKAGQMLAGTIDPINPAVGLLDLRGNPAHAPSLAYVPYLVTGDRYYADELAFWCNFYLLGNWGSQADPRADTGLIVGNSQPRAIAWSLRDLADAAAYLPDGDPLKPYFAKAVKANLDWLQKQAALPGPLGVRWICLPASAADATLQRVQPWQQNFAAYAIEHANAQGFAGGTAFRDQVVRFQTLLFNSPEYPRAYAGPADFAIGRWGKDAAGKPVLNQFATLAEVFAASYPNGAKPVPFWGFYGIDANMALLIAAREGMPGAAEALVYLATQNGDYLRRHPGWNLAPWEPLR